MDKALLVLAGAVLCQSFWGVVIADHWVGAVVMVPLAILAISMAGGSQ